MNYLYLFMHFTFSSSLSSLLFLLLQWTFAAISAVVARDPVNSALRLFLPQPHPSPDQGQDEPELSTSYHDAAAAASTAAMVMVTCGQRRAQTLVQAASLLLLHQPAPTPSALAPSSSSSSSSSLLQQQREDVAEEIAGALCALLAALKANAPSATSTITSAFKNTNNGHLLALSLLVSGGVVEALARLLQQAMHLPAAATTATSILSPAVPDKNRARGEAPLVVARCVRALAILTQDNNNDNDNDNNNDASLTGCWLRAVSEESVARCVSTTKQRTGGGLLKVLCAVILQYSHCQQHPPLLTGQNHLTAAAADEAEVEVISSLQGGQGLGMGLGLEPGLGLLGHEADDDEGQRSVAVWGVAVLLDILECTRCDLDNARRPGSSLAHYIQLAGNTAITNNTDATASNAAASKAAMTTTPPSSSWLSGGKDGGGARARALLASGVRGKLLQGGVAASLCAVLRAHIDAVVKCEHAHAAAAITTAGDGDGGGGSKSQRDQQRRLWPSTAAAAMAARAMGLLLTLTLTLHTTTTTTTHRPSPFSVDAVGAGSSALGCFLGQGTKMVMDRDSGSGTGGGGTLAAHTSLRKVG